MPNANFPTYYNSANREEGQSIFEIWETGAAFRDSITPAVHVDHYREHIIRQIVGHATEDRKILSLGCGNGFVEASLLELGYTVDAIDLHEDAVQFSRKKRVNARVQDFYHLTAGDLDNVGCVYADGFIGHLYNQVGGLNDFIAHLKEIVRGKDIYCVLSNDAPLDPKLRVQRHEVVPDFWYVSIEYLVDLLKAEGFQGISSQYYGYDRPISGTRRRAIVGFASRSN